MTVVIGILGLMVGSFLNVLIARSESLSTAVTGRSACPHCHKALLWYDLVPVLSFIALGSKCRFCHRPISWQYPVVELLTALLAIHLYSVEGLTIIAGLHFIIFALLLVIAVIDWQESVIPDIYALPAILLSFIATSLIVHPTVSPVLWGVLLAGGGLAALVLVSNEQWMGAGDIELGVIMGLLAGWLGSIVGLALAFMAGAVVSAVALLIRRKKMKDLIPFGPFLIAATYAATLWGDQLAIWYLRLIHFYF